MIYCKLEQQFQIVAHIFYSIVFSPCCKSLVFVLLRETTLLIEVGISAEFLVFLSCIREYPRACLKIVSERWSHHRLAIPIYLSCKQALSQLKVKCTNICSFVYFMMWQCLFPHELIKSIKTPIFLVNPSYDFWQVSSHCEYTSMYLCICL